MTEKEIIIQITRYIKGELNDREEDLLWEEFLKNPEYYDLFETELNLADLYQNKNFKIDDSRNHNNVHEPKRGYKTWPVAAAAAILIAAAFYLFLFTFQAESGPDFYAMSEIELTEMLGSDIYRDDHSETGGLDQQINRALSIAFDGDNDRAFQILSNLSEEPASDIQEIRIFYNLGILAYNDDNYEQALEYFSEIQTLDYSETPDYLFENINWFSAHIYLKRGEIEEAMALLESISTEKGIHSQKAEQLLSEIKS